MIITAQDRKKIVLSILIVILLGLQVHRFWGEGSKDKAGSRPLSQRSKVHSHDPLKLRLDLLEPGKVATEATSRNLFGPGDEEIKERGPVKPGMSGIPPIIKPPEPELPSLEYVGFVEYAGGKLAVFSRGQGMSQELSLLKVSDRAEGKFELREIKEDWVMFCNLSTGKEARLNIVERAPSMLPSVPGSPFPSPIQRPLPMPEVRRLPPIPSGFPPAGVAPPGSESDNKKER